MNSLALIDTGVVTAYYSKRPTAQVIELMERVKEGKTCGQLLRPIMVEVYSHLCKLPGGMQFAESTLASFMAEFSLEIVPLDASITYKAGKLKCQHRTSLSMVDCLAIAYCLNRNVTFHTTEKGLKKLIPRLKIATYSFTR